MTPDGSDVADHNFVPDDLLRQIIGVGQVDLLVGLPTHDHDGSVGEIARAARACFRTFFPRQRAALLHAEQGTTGGAPSAVDQAWHAHTSTPDRTSGLRTTHLITSWVGDHHDEGGATRTVLAAADLLQASAVVVLDADLARVTPERIAALIAPVRERQTDLVAPVYHRAASDGLLVTQLLHPLMRAVYGRHLREPLIPEFGCSGAFATHCTQQAWHTTHAQRNTHFWIAAEAVSGAFAVVQRALGVRQLVPNRPHPALPELFTHVVGSAFASIEAHSATWLARSGDEDVPTIGSDTADQQPSDASQDGARLLGSFEQDVRNLEEILRRILTADVHAALKATVEGRDRDARLPAALWAAIVADFLLAYHHNVMRRDHIAQALLSLYMARTGTFLCEHATNTPDALEAARESLCGDFKQIKTQLVERWSEPAVR
jgi:hypothetical protein